MLPAWIEAPDGQRYLNQLKRFVKGGILVPGPNLNPATTPAAGVDPGLSPTVTVQGMQDAACEIYSMMGRHATTDNADVVRRLQVEITDQRYLRRLMNRPVLANHVFGTGQYPIYMYETIMLEAQQNLVYQFINPSAAGDSHFQFALEHRKFIDSNVNQAFLTRWLKENRKRKELLYPFWLTSNNAVSVPASGTRDVFFTTTQDIMLVLFEVWCDFITTGVAGDLQEGLTFEFFNPKNGRPLQNRPVSLNCCAGRSQTNPIAYKLPCPLMVEPASNMLVRMTSLITDQPTEVFMTFFGVAYFQGNGPWQYPDRSKLTRGPYTEVPPGDPSGWMDQRLPQAPQWAGRQNPPWPMNSNAGDTGGQGPNGLDLNG